MNKSLKKMMTLVIVLALVFTTVFSLVACKKDEQQGLDVHKHTWGEWETEYENDYECSKGVSHRTCSSCGEVQTKEIKPSHVKGEDGKCIYCGVEVYYTNNTYTAVSPSNWNELTYQDENDRQIMSYIGSPFFEFDYKFDSEGNIVPGDFEVEYSAATKLEDVTADYAEEMGYAAGATGYAWKITLRNDLKWNDGTGIKAEDFVYTMKEQLNPLFRNYRADSFYNSGTVIHNAQGYAKQGLVVDETVSNLFSGIAAA